MQITFEVPDDLGQRLKDVPQQRVVHALQQVVEQRSIFTEENDPWVNPDVKMTTGHSGIGDLAVNHDHYLYGTPKKPEK